MYKFMVVFFLLYFLFTYYLYKRLLLFFYIKKNSVKIFKFFYFCFSFLFFGGVFIEQFYINFFTEFLIRIGAIFLFFFFYFFLFSIIFDILSFFFKKIKIFKREIASISIVIIVLLFVYGFHNFYNLMIKYVDINIDKPKFNDDTLNIAYVSDIHLGTFVNKRKLDMLIDTILAHKPNILLIGGDLIDNNIEVVKYYDLLKFFRRLKLPLGIYMCTGNHEYIGKYFLDLKYIKQNNINILKDSTILIDNLFYLIGRDDIRSRRERKNLFELVEQVDFNYPVILLDHQPWNLDETKKFPIDLQLSGHTHHGQIFPINLITKLIYEKDWGYLKKGNTNYYISCGFGGALFPVRIGSKPELIFIRLIKK